MHSIKCQYYNDEEKNIPNIWVVNSNDSRILRLDIKHFDCFHTSYTPKTVLHVLNSVGLRFSKEHEFFILSGMLIPFQKVLFEHGFCVKRKCDHSISKFNPSHKFSLSYNKIHSAYEANNVKYIDEDFQKPLCMRNLYSSRHGDCGFVNEEDLASFVFFARFVDGVKVFIKDTKADVLFSLRNVDPCFAKLNDRLSATPFKEIPDLDYKRRLHFCEVSKYASSKINIKRIVEFNEADAVIQKYISNNGQMDEKAETRRNINTAQRQKSEHANRFEISEKLKRLKHREKYRLSINLKQKQLMFGEFEAKMKVKEKVVIIDPLIQEKIWLNEEKEHANLREYIMNEDIETMMNSTPSFYSSDESSLCSCGCLENKSTISEEEPVATKVADVSEKSSITNKPNDEDFTVEELSKLDLKNIKKMMIAMIQYIRSWIKIKVKLSKKLM